MDLGALVEPRVDLPRLAKVLGELGHEGRLAATRGWSKRTLRTLYDAARGFRPLTLDDFVPAGTPPLTEVVHHGTNSLPAFSHFQKRFCRPSEASPGAGRFGREVLWGYNHQAFGGFTGPGYFVAHASAEPGEIDIDYTMPAEERAPAWPALAPAGTLLGVFVYRGMVDVMRGVSGHVTIGRALRGGRPSAAWFVLVREDPA